VTEPPDPSPVNPPRFRRWALGGLLIGLALGGGYGLWDGWATFHSRERQDAEIHAALAIPHMDSTRYYARVCAVRYQSLESLLAWRGGRGGLVGGLAGGVVGMIGWLVAAVIRERRAKRAGLPFTEPQPARGFTLIELLIVLVGISAVFALVVEGPSGLVYYQGKDQTRWLMQLNSADPAERAEAVKAACHILDHHRCYCREATVERLGTMGPEAAPAVPVMRRLAEREPEFRELVETAIRRIESPDPKP
jgi:prepilin-type N-terminal cleavage/methylation domain-containing protein